MAALGGVMRTIAAAVAEGGAGGTAWIGPARWDLAGGKP